MQRWSSPAVLALAGVVGMQACASSEAMTSCTQMGGIDGIVLQIPRSLFVQTGTVDLEVCAGGDCRSTTQALGRLRGPVGRGARASFEALGKDFSPGTVTVSVDLRGPDGGVIATRRQQVELIRSYPNGKGCDGDASVSGPLRLRAGDRV